MTVGQMIDKIIPETLGKARGYVAVYVLTQLNATIMLYAGKLDSGDYSTLTIGLFVALSAGGGIAAFRKAQEIKARNGNNAAVTQK